MRAKIFLSTLLIMSILGLFCMKPTRIHAQECDYVDDDGYCVIVVDNKDKIPSIGEMTDEYSSEKVDEQIFVDITVNTNRIDESNGFGQFDETREKLIQEYQKEYQMIVQGSPALKGDEQVFVNARLRGLSYLDAYKQCFTYDREVAIEEVFNHVSENKEWYQTFFDQMNSETITETLKHFGEMIVGWFTD